MDIVSYSHADGALSKANEVDTRTSNVDNTSDADKPVSSAVQTALDGKEDADADIVKAPLGVLPVLDGSNLTGVASTVTDLTDTTITTPTDTQVLTYDTATGKWVNADSASSTTVDALTDTTITTPTDTQVLTYETATGKWINSDATGGAEVINDLTDVDTTTAAPSTDEVLTWNGTKWVPAAASGGGSEHYDQEGTPTPSATGATWFVPSTGVTYKYVNDGTTNVWVDISSSTSPQGARLNESNTWTAGQRGSWQVSTDGTFALADAQHVKISNTANVTVSLPSDMGAAIAGQTGLIWFPDASTYTVSWGVGWFFKDGAAPTLSGGSYLAYAVNDDGSGIACGTPVNSLGAV